MPETDDQEQTGREEATTHGDLYERKGKPDPEAWEKAESVTGRPNDLVAGEVHNSTMAERAKARPKPETKVVDDDDAENKAITKAPAKRATRRGQKD